MTPIMSTFFVLPDSDTSGLISSNVQLDRMQQLTMEFCPFSQVGYFHLPISVRTAQTL